MASGVGAELDTLCICTEFRDCLSLTNRFDCKGEAFRFRRVLAFERGARAMLGF